MKNVRTGQEDMGIDESINYFPIDWLIVCNKTNGRKLPEPNVMFIF